MKRARVLGLVAMALVAPLQITAAVVLWMTRAEDDTAARPKPPAVAPPKSFNAVGLPPVHVEPCPSGADLLQAPAAGADVLPDVTLECIGEIGSSDTVALRRLGGVPTVVNIWSTSCEPCRREMPDLESVHVRAAGRVRIIGVNNKDYAEGARATILNTGVTFPSLVDVDEQVRLGVGSAYMPTTVFVRADGRIVHRKVGAFADEASIRTAIAEHLGVTL